MNLIAFDEGRVLQLFVGEEIRPYSGVSLPVFFSRLIDHYVFLERPPNFGDAIKAGAKFLNGHLTFESRDIAIKELAIYNDGIVVACHKTSDGEVVLADLMEWASKEFHMRPPITLKPRTYSSALIVEFSDSLDPLLNKFDKIAQRISSALNRAYGWDYDTHVARLGFKTDPTKLAPFTNTEFYLERRIDVPYSTNRFYSGAPLTTEQHLMYLGEFEKILEK